MDGWPEIPQMAGPGPWGPMASGMMNSGMPGAVGGGGGAGFKRNMPCRYFMNTGSCFYGNGCQFLHGTPSSNGPGVPGIPSPGLVGGPHGRPHPIPNAFPVSRPPSIGAMSHPHGAAAQRHGPHNGSASHPSYSSGNSSGPTPFSLADYHELEPVELHMNLHATVFDPTKDSSNGSLPPSSMPVVYSLYKGLHAETGQPVTLRRIHGYSQAALAGPAQAKILMDMIKHWSCMTHSNIVTFRTVFTTKAFGDMSLVIVTDNHDGDGGGAGATTRSLGAIHFPEQHNSIKSKASVTHNMATNGGVANGGGSHSNGGAGAGAGAGGPSGAGGASNGSVNGTTKGPHFASDARPFSHQAIKTKLLPEPVLWNYIIQLSAAIRTIHAAGLAHRGLDMSRILVTPVPSCSSNASNIPGSPYKLPTSDIAHQHPLAHHHLQQHKNGSNHSTKSNGTSSSSLTSGAAATGNASGLDKARLRLDAAGLVDLLEVCGFVVPTDTTSVGEKSWSGDLVSFPLPPASARLAAQQQTDLVDFGKILLALATNSLASSNQENWQDSINTIKRSYSADLYSLICYLLTAATRNSNAGVVNGVASSSSLFPAAGPTTTPPSINDIMPRIGARFYHQLDAHYRREDEVTLTRTRTADLSHMFATLIKLNQINERPAVRMDTQWSETGDRYLLKLFRDYLFHQSTETGAAWLELGHVLASLRKFEAASQERLCLMSRDDQNVLIVSYAELKRCFDTSYQELLMA